MNAYEEREQRINARRFTGEPPTHFGSLEWAMRAVEAADPLDQLVAEGKITPAFARALRGATRTEEGAQIKRDDIDCFDVPDEPAIGSDE